MLGCWSSLIVSAGSAMKPFTRTPDLFRPLTLLENWLEGRAGVEPYQGGFLLHYLDKLVYPDISTNVVTIAGVIVCVANLAFYARQVWISWHAHR
jgi:hypothetical protein